MNEETPQIARIETSLEHVVGVLQELRLDHKQTQMVVADVQTVIAGMKATLNERSKVADWMIAAVVSALTATGITGLAKAVVGGVSTGK